MSKHIAVLIRQTLCLIAFLSLSLTLSAQNVVRTRKVVSVLTEQNFYLNGGVRASMGGKSRTYYEIALPKNTIEWYYVFTTSKPDNDNAKEVIGLTAQLTKLIDPTGTTAIVTSAIFAPTGAGAADVYLTDWQNVQAFIEKKDNWGGSFKYAVSGSRENYKQGVVQIRDLTKGTYYLGIKNPSSTEGINVKLEVSAIVEDVETTEMSDNDNKANMYGTLGWTAFEKGDYNKCLELSQKALLMNDNLPWVKLNLALTYLVLRNEKYTDAYIEAINSCKKSDDPKGYIKSGIKDINDLLRRTGDIEHSDEILTLLKTELRNL